MNNAKVLIVEDEEALGLIISDTLETRGFRTIRVADGALAYQTYVQEDTQTPILFLTARSTTEDLIKGFKAGGNDYIKKPFDLEELVIRIEVIVNRVQVNEATESSAGEVVAIGDFQFDMMRNILFFNNKSIRLSARESAVLAILYQYKSQLLTRKTLLLQVWQNDDFFSSRSLDVYISKLRRHLHSDPSIQIINHRGFGYKLIC